MRYILFLSICDLKGFESVLMHHVPIICEGYNSSIAEVHVFNSAGWQV